MTMTMSSPSSTVVREDDPVSNPGPRAGGPTRRSFTPAQKLDHLAAYGAAVAQGEGGAYLRAEGLYSSQITEWRKLRMRACWPGRNRETRSAE